MPKVPYLGHIISEKGIAPNPEKTKAVETFPVPKTKTDVKSFLGLCNYYRKFIKDFSHTATALTQLLKKDNPFHWTDACHKAFQTLKDTLVTSPILMFPDFSKPFILYTDASDYAIGYILGQLDDQGKERVIAYSGRSMNEAERRWGITDKEGLALVEGVRHYKVYLSGKPFTVYTDHSALKSLQLPKEHSGRKQRWYEFLQAFEYTIIHKPGRKHNNADALSRRTYADTQATLKEPEPNTFPLVLAMQATCAPNEQHMPSAEFPAPLRREQLKDDSLGPLIQYLENGTLPDDVKMTKVILNTCAEYEILHGVLVKRYFPPGKTPKEDRIIKQLMVPSTLF